MKGSVVTPKCETCIVWTSQQASVPSGTPQQASVPSGTPQQASVPLDHYPQVNNL
jgi:hypothetical protein